MHFTRLTVIAPLLLITSSAASIPIHNDNQESPAKRAALPFNKIIAFGDDFTDDGSGSYAHGITGNQQTGAGKHMWGYNTFTDGLIAVSYLSKKLDLPISYNYAWGSAGGAQVIGSICDNAVIPVKKQTGHAHYNGSLVPSAADQVNNYTQSGVFTDDIAKTLHFFWTGNNDMIASLGWAGRFTLCAKDTLCIPGQNKFIAKLLTCFQSNLKKLIKAGAKHIIVPNVYPRHSSPWTSMWITQTVGLVDNFGQVIDRFNSQLSDLVDSMNEQYGTNIMLYDVNSYMQSALANSSIVDGAGYSYTCVDGCNKQVNPNGTSNWNMYWNHTIVHHQPDLFFWMTEVTPSTTVFNDIATDMRVFLNSQTY